MLCVREQLKNTNLIKQELEDQMIKQWNKMKDYKIDNHQMLLQNQ